MNLFGPASVYFAANFLSAGIPFLLLPILTRILTPGDYGAVAMFSVTLNVFNCLTGLSVHGAVGVRFFDLPKEELAQYITTCLGILVLSTVFLVLLVFLLQQWLVDFTGLPISWLLVAALVSGFQFLGILRLSLWQVSGDAWRYGIFQVSRTALDVLLSLFFVLAASMAWQGRALGQSTALAVVGCAAFIWLFRDGMVAKTPNWKIHAVDALKFGLPLIPHSIGALLITVTDRFVVNSFLGAESVGIYMVSLQLSMGIALLTESFNKAYAPWLFRHLAKDDGDRRRSIVIGTYGYFVIILLFSVVYSAAVFAGLPFLAGPDYQSSPRTILYLSLGFAFGGCYYMVNNYIFYARRTQILSLITLLCGLLNVPITVFLTKTMKLDGAALAFLITNALFFVLTWAASRWVYPMPWLLRKQSNS